MTEIETGALVSIYGWRCTGCGHVAPDDNDMLDPDVWASAKAVTDAVWQARGRGEWIQEGWPKAFPEEMVREGFACSLCLAPLLLAVTP